jgi:XTP/dITP diphosphohydrolase
VTAKQDCRKLVLASANPHKLREFRQILAPLGVEVLSVGEVGVSLDVEENGATFAENAAIKARALYKLCGLPAVADDSGLCVDALDGRPGLHSARYGGGGLTNLEQIRLLLEELDGVPPERRTARFVAAIHCVLDEETELACEGACPGVIGLALGGDNGFGYDPIFYVGDKTFAQLPATEKDAISHRGVALRKLAEMLQSKRAK